MEHTGNIAEKNIRKALFILISITTLIRIFVAATLELSVDEVYYWTYALYPDWSHFDHPPMVGWVIQLFSLNLLFDNELALRMGAIVISILNTLTIYSIGKYIKNPLTGLYAALLFNASVYCSVLAGNFIIPDTPQLLFWLLSLKFFLKALPADRPGRQEDRQLLLASLFAGLAIISKYHGVFIWAGAGLYILIYNRAWFKKPSLYAGVVISALFTLPIIIWNIRNDWISFNFHSGRVTPAFEIRPDYFFTEIFGQVAYNNPVNYVLIVMAMVAIWKGKKFMRTEYRKILLLDFLPIWAVFTSFAIFRSTLPHWTGPAFTPLIVVAAAWLADKPVAGLKNILFPKPARIAIILLYSLMLLAWGLINYYPGTIGKKSPVSQYGDMDFTLDMYGWKQLKGKFEKVMQRDVASGKISEDAPIINPRYFPGAEIDYYIGRPLHKKVILPGNIKDIHKYAWINEYRGGLKKGESAYMITTSNWYHDPYEFYSNNFEKIHPMDTIEIRRSGVTAYYAFIYIMESYKGNFSSLFHVKSPK